MLERSQPETRSRVGYCFAYRRLAHFAGLSIELLEGLDKGYELEEIDIDGLPTDAQLLKVREGIGKALGSGLRFNGDLQYPQS